MDLTMILLSSWPIVAHRVRCAVGRRVRCVSCVLWHKCHWCGCAVANDRNVCPRFGHVRPDQCRGAARRGVDEGDRCLGMQFLFHVDHQHEHTECRGTSTQDRHNEVFVSFLSGSHSGVSWDKFAAGGGCLAGVGNTTIMVFVVIELYFLLLYHVESTTHQIIVFR